MNYLLDTHALLWAITDKSKLSHAVKQILEDPNNTIFVSAVSFWEVSLKFSLGKLQLDGFSVEELPDLSEMTGFELLPLSAGESASYHQLGPVAHKDPFDKMLMWQAVKLKLTLITKDENIRQSKLQGFKTIW